MFTDVLQALISRLPDVQGAAMVGVDGIPIAGIPSRPGLDLEKVAAECTTLIKSAAATGKALDYGAPREVVVRCAQAQALLRSVTAEYFLCLVVGPDAPIGRARYELRKACRLLEGELA